MRTIQQRSRYWPSDWPEAADIVLQGEPYVDRRRRNRARIAAESVTHIEALGLLAEQLLAEREYWAGIALGHGATDGDVAGAMSAGSRIGGAVSHAREIIWPGWGVGARLECVDCSHQFHPDSSPDSDRCWQCSERREEE
jgi:hypothetical protein